MKIAIVGSGNLATHLCFAFQSAGHTVTGIYSKTKKHSEVLASKAGVSTYVSLDSIMDVDLVILAVKDSAIREVSLLLSSVLPVVHTSGNTEMDVLHGENRGVLYPVQTFSPGRKINLSDVPICIEASNEKLLKKLELLAESVSKNVVQVDSDQRQFLHLAAVLVNNFPNHLFLAAEELLEANELSPELLLPLIKETVSKLDDVSPFVAQTGPAMRGDVNTIQHHLNLIADDEDLRIIYAAITNRIMKTYRDENPGA